MNVYDEMQHRLFQAFIQREISALAAVTTREFAQQVFDDVLCPACAATLGERKL